MIRTKMLNLAEAKARLSHLVQRASKGEEIIIARNGQPLARLVPLAPRAVRVPGKGAGQWSISDDFNEPLPAEILVDFRGGAE